MEIHTTTENLNVGDVIKFNKLTSTVYSDYLINRCLNSKCLIKRIDNFYMQIEILDNNSCDIDDNGEKLSWALDKDETWEIIKVNN